MSGQDEGPGGVAEPGSGAEHKEGGPGPEGGAQGQMELDALRSFVEVVFTTSMYAWTCKRTC